MLPSLAFEDEIVQIRQAVLEDYEALCALDPVAATSWERRSRIRDWVMSSRCYVLPEKNGVLVAYGVLTHDFFDQAFIQIVMVSREYQRQGFGAAMVSQLKSIKRGSKLFSSTNLSNRPMQMLFAKLGFRISGCIDNLDDGDPEIIFYHPPE